jgi:hypothetical protein
MSLAVRNLDIQAFAEPTIVHEAAYPGIWGRHHRNDRLGIRVDESHLGSLSSQVAAVVTVLDDAFGVDSDMLDVQFACYDNHITEVL